MAKLARRQALAVFPDLLDWQDSPWTALLPFMSGRTFRVEDFVWDNRCAIRAELPGLDQEKDIEVPVGGGTMTIHAERREEDREPHRSEFGYGSLTRSVTLPARVDAKDVSARYEKESWLTSRPFARCSQSASRRDDQCVTPRAASASGRGVTVAERIGRSASGNVRMHMRFGMALSRILNEDSRETRVRTLVVSMKGAPDAQK